LKYFPQHPILEDPEYYLYAVPQQYKTTDKIIPLQILMFIVFIGDSGTKNSDKKDRTLHPV
jgi:hypothetical protein